MQLEQVYRQKMTVKVMKYDESFYNILIRSGLAFKCIWPKNFKVDLPGPCTSNWQKGINL
jgi:hypothetical protein